MDNNYYYNLIIAFIPMQIKDAVNEHKQEENK